MEGKHSMYYPKQIPYLLNKEFRENIEYKEYNVKELEDYCMCIWTMKSKKILNKTISNNILPDACIDIVIDFVSNTISFAGFSKGTKDFKLDKNIDYIYDMPIGKAVRASCSYPVVFSPCTYHEFLSFFLFD